jgi:hypothetical protein
MSESDKGDGHKKRESAKTLVRNARMPIKLRWFRPMSRLWSTERVDWWANQWVGFQDLLGELVLRQAAGEILFTPYLETF